MLISKRTYRNKYAIGGAGIFHSIGNFFAIMFSSNAALGSTALQAGKNCSKRYRNEMWVKQLELILVRN